MRILAIETSCDETSIALVEAQDNSLFIHSHKTASQAEFHSQFGGVFPAMAKREHIKACVPLLASVLDESKEIMEKDWQTTTINEETKNRITEILHKEPELLQDILNFFNSNTFPKIDIVSVTQGPGLEMSLWVGINFAKSLGQILNVPIVGINHMHGHLVSPLLPEEIAKKEIPLKTIPDNFVTLLVSGGHTQLFFSENGTHKLLGETVDDAVGEAFDKVARLMNLPYPGGPVVSKLAETARERNVDPVELPRPMIYSNDFNFSYSGLKTAVMYHIRKNPLETENDILALALGFENAAIEVLVKKTVKALVETGSSALLLGGGVAANTHLKNMLRRATTEHNVEFYEPTQSITGDNALMIALATYIEYKNKPIIDQSNTIKADGMLTIA